MQIGFILSLIFAIVVAIFAIQNSAIIYVNFLFTTIQVSQALIIFISAILGAIIVMLLGLKREYNIRKENKYLNQKLSKVEEENLNLKQKLEDMKNTVPEKVDIIDIDESALDKE